MRDFDCTSPGSGIPGVNKPELSGVLRLGGALQVPDADLNEDDLAERQKFEDWDQPYPDDFETGLAQFINLPDDYSRLKPQAANAATSLEAVVSGESRSFDHFTALRPVALADAAPADESRRDGRTQPYELGTPPQSRSALPHSGELRH